MILMRMIHSRLGDDIDDLFSLFVIQFLIVSFYLSISLSL